MKPHNLFSTKKLITNWLKLHYVHNYTLIASSEYGFVVDVGGNIFLTNYKFPCIMVKFNRIDGDFKCFGNKLTSLFGGPEMVAGDFDCSNNNLANLQYCPKFVGGKFDCSNNQLISLGGVPQKGKSFVCSNNLLKSLEGGPQEVRGDFNCEENYLSNLMSGPKICEGTFSCQRNKLVSLAGAPLQVKNFFCENNLLNTLEHIPKKILLDLGSCANKLNTLIYGPEFLGGEVFLLKNEELYKNQFITTWDDLAKAKEEDKIKFERGVMLLELIKEQKKLSDTGDCYEGSNKVEVKPGRAADNFKKIMKI